MTVNPRQSFKLKLCLSIIGASLIAYFLIFASTVYFTSREIKDSVAAIVSSKMALATKALDDKITDIEIASANLISMVENSFTAMDPKSANKVGKAFLDANYHIQGVCIGYPDGTIFGHPGPWCPYVMRQGNEYVVRDLAQTKDFTQSEWFTTPAQTHSKTWALPFRESNGTVITSYNVPIFKGDSELPVCVVAVDQNLTELSDSLQNLRPYEGANVYMIDQSGRYIAHPDHASVFDTFASEEILGFVDSDEDFLIQKTKDGDVYFFRSKIAKTGWTLLLSVPRKTILARSNKMLNSILLNMLLGIILLLTSSLYVISRLTKPLESFAEAARRISHGDFDVDLPVIKDHNELYDLRVALASMKVSLDDYVSKLEETSNKKASIERELDIARRIQMAMIPKIFPPYPDKDNLDIFASLTPAQAVGGDLYDFVLLDNKFFFCIGDVSGKGVPASLLMAITRTLFRNTSSVDKTPAQIATILNNAITEGNDMGMFVTMMIGSFDILTGELQICNCGHNKPVTNGKIVDPATMTVEPTSEYHLIGGVPVNIALGVVPGFEFTQVVMHITPGCMLMLYTDGVTEAENQDKELYDDPRMLACMTAMGREVTSRELVDNLVADVKSFAGDAEQSDDITLLCIRCNRLG